MHAIIFYISVYYVPKDYTVSLASTQMKPDQWHITRKRHRNALYIRSDCKGAGAKEQRVPLMFQ